MRLITKFLGYFSLIDEIHNVIGYKSREAKVVMIKMRYDAQIGSDETTTEIIILVVRLNLIPLKFP